MHGKEEENLKRTRKSRERTVGNKIERRRETRAERGGYGGSKKCCKTASSVLKTPPEESKSAQQIYDLLKNQLPRLLLVGVPSPPWIVGVAGVSPPPPRRGLAIRLPALVKLKPPPAPPRPRVLPALAASRRSLTEASWTSNLGRRSLGQHRAYLVSHLCYA